MYNNDGYKVMSQEKIAQAKRKLKLDLNLSGNMGSNKRSRPNTLNPLLTSPDLNMLKLASPELDRLLLQQVGGHLFTPVTRGPTNEQEEFAKGFVDKLEQMHCQNTTNNTLHIPNSIVVTSGGTISGLQYTQLQPPPPPHSAPLSSDMQIPQIKEEPLMMHNSNSPPLSPIDMENQEKIKLERKRLRNRIAASKCRKRKLERISKLEDKVNGLKNENLDLQTLANKLKEQVYSLKEEVMDHFKAGCKIQIRTDSWN